MKRFLRFKCEPCAEGEKVKPDDTCLLCTVPDSPVKVKIVSKRGGELHLTSLTHKNRNLNLKSSPY